MVPSKAVLHSEEWIFDRFCTFRMTDFAAKVPRQSSNNLKIGMIVEQGSVTTYKKIGDPFFLIFEIFIGKGL